MKPKIRYLNRPDPLTGGGGESHLVGEISPYGVRMGIAQYQVARLKKALLVTARPDALSDGCAVRATGPVGGVLA